MEGVAHTAHARSQPERGRVPVSGRGNGATRSVVRRARSGALGVHVSGCGDGATREQERLGVLPVAEGGEEVCFDTLVERLLGQCP